MTDKKLEPNKEEMLTFVQHLFDDCMQDGLIELAWTPPNESNVKYGLLFGLGELESLVDEAARLNSNEGVNVFVGPGIRHPHTAKGSRANDTEVIYLPALYADLDDPGVAEAAEELYQNLKPTLIVTTGKIPHLRQQLWWKLEDPAKDLFQSSAQIKGITEILHGDGSVHNPSRVMRLPGSIAWPKKDERVEEMTSLQLGVAHKYDLDNFQHNFPPRPDLITKPTAKTSEQASSVLEKPKKGTPLNLPEAKGLLVEECLKDIHTPHRWHLNVLRLTGHWVRLGLSDAEIALMAPSLTLPRFSVNQTYHEMQVMIKGARIKWDIDDPMKIVTEEDSVIPLVADFLTDLKPSLIPPRQWILGRSLLKGYLSVLVAPPGVGKSTLGIAQAVAIITGKEITGQRVERRGKVWIYNNEDDSHELKRRLSAVLQHNKIEFSEIRGQLALNSGADRPLLVATLLPDGTVLRTPDIDACVEHIKRNEITVFIADPFVETHELEENSNQQIKMVAQMFREIARRADCAVQLVHHTSKPQRGSSEGYAGDMNSARGASSLIGVTRVIETLFGMSKSDAEFLGIPAKERHLYIRLDDAKANLSLVTPDTKWFKRVGVVIANTDEVGTLESVNLGTDIDKESDIAEINHRVIASLAALVPEESLTVNAAAIRLSLEGSDFFRNYRQTDKRGNKRASKTLRDMIIRACKSKIEIVTDKEVVSFTVTDVAPLTIRRFSRPFEAADLASLPPDFPATENQGVKP